MKFHDSDLTVSEFEKMGLPTKLMAALIKIGLDKPTPIQAEAIPVALKGSNLIGVAQTGSGKTLAYALSVLTTLFEKTEARALILLPSRETAVQVHSVILPLCTELDLTVCLAVAGIPNAIQTKELKKIPRLIIATPGRLEEHLKNNKLMLKGLSILVLDEADRMLSMGFEAQLAFMKRTLRASHQTLMFAATFGPWAEPIAEMFMEKEAVLIKSKAAETPVTTLEQKVFFLSPQQKQNRLLDELRRMKDGVILFADSQENCVSLGRLLTHHHFSSDFMHGDMNPGHRNRVLRDFREEKIQILVTTDLLARGLDVPHVKHVVNYDLPYKAEDFLHRIGRTARAGRSGSAITFVTPADGRTYRKIKSYLQGAVEVKLASNFKFEDRG